MEVAGVKKPQVWLGSGPPESGATMTTGPG